MTKAAVKRQFDVFVNEIIDGSYDAFKPWGTIGPRNLPGNMILKFLMRPIIINELSHYRVSYNHQFQLMTDYAADLANDEGVFEDYRDDILGFDYFYQNFHGSDREREVFESALEDRYITMAEDVAPLVASDEDDFWDALQDCYDKREARRLMRHNFDYADILQDHEEHIELYSSIPGVDFNFPIQYTSEGLKTLDESEGALRSRLLKRVETIY